MLCLGKHQGFSIAGEYTNQGETEAGVRGHGQTRSEGSHVPCWEASAVLSTGNGKVLRELPERVQHPGHVRGLETRLRHLEKEGGLSCEWGKGSNPDLGTRIVIKRPLQSLHLSSSLCLRV